MNQRREEIQRQMNKLRIEKMQDENDAKQLYQKRILEAKKDKENRLLQIKTGYITQYSNLSREYAATYESTLEPANPPADSGVDNPQKGSQ